MVSGVSFKRFLVGTSMAVALLGIYRQWLSNESVNHTVIGKNNTVLFMVNSEPGLSNVFVATAHALLEQYPHIQIHFASFPPIASQLARVSSHARKQSPAARDITLHQLSTPSYYNCTVRSGRTMKTAVSPPGLAGIAQTAKDIQFYISPWTAEEHFIMYQELDTIINKTDPAVIVLDTLLRPAVDITRDRNRLHSIISPNTLIDNFPTHQPLGGMFWKYPA